MTTLIADLPGPAPIAPETVAPAAPHHSETPADARGALDDPALHLDELVQHVRSRLALPAAITDAAIRSDLGRIAARASRQERWRAAFGSEIAAVLMARGSDLNTALNILLGLTPPPRL